MRLGKTLHRGEAKADAALSGVRSAHVGLEDALLDIARQAWAIVFYLEARAIAAVHDADLDMPFWPTAYVLDRVAHEVRDEAIEDAGVAADGAVEGHSQVDLHARNCSLDSKVRD